MLQLPETHPPPNSSTTTTRLLALALATQDTVTQTHTLRDPSPILPLPLWSKQETTRLASALEHDPRARPPIAVAHDRCTYPDPIAGDRESCRQNEFSTAHLVRRPGRAYISSRANSQRDASSFGQPGHEAGCCCCFRHSPSRGRHSDRSRRRANVYLDHHLDQTQCERQRVFRLLRQQDPPSEEGGWHSILAQGHSV